MSLTAADIRVKFSSEGADSVKKDITGVGGAVDNVQSKLSGWGKNLRGIGTMWTAGITAPLTAFFTTAINGASSLEQAQGKVDAVFKDSANTVLAWSDTTSQAFGISNTQALQWTGTLGNFFTSAGVATDQSAKFSRQLIELSADMGAFNDVSAARASDAIISAFAGEYDALQRLGVNINAAKVEQEAMNIALADGREEITDADMAMARYNVIMRETTNQQGQFARESKGFAGQLAILKAQFTEVAAQLGGYLMPVATQFLGTLRGWVDAFGQLSPSIQKWVVGIGLAAAAIGPLLIALGMMLPAIAFLISPIGLVIAGIAALAAGFIYAYRNSETFRNAINGLARGIAAGIGAIRDFIAGIESVQDFFVDLQRVLDRFRDRVADAFDLATAAAGPFGDTVEKIGNIFDAVLGVAINLLGSLAALLRGDLSSAWTLFKAAAEEALGGIAELATLIPTLLLDIFEAIDWGDVWEGIQDAWDAIPWTALANGAVDLIVAGFRAAGAAAGDVFGWLSDALFNAFDQMSFALQTGLQLAWDAITSLTWSDFVPMLSWGTYIAGKIADVGVWLWDKLKGAFNNGSALIGGAISDLGTWLWDKLKGWFGDGDLITGSIGDLGTWLWDKLKGWFGDGNLITGSIGDLGEWLWSKLDPLIPDELIPEFPGWDAFFDWINPFGGDKSGSDEGGPQFGPEVGGPNLAKNIWTLLANNLGLLSGGTGTSTGGGSGTKGGPDWAGRMPDDADYGVPPDSVRAVYEMTTALDGLLVSLTAIPEPAREAGEEVYNAAVRIAASKTLDMQPFAPVRTDIAELGALVASQLPSITTTIGANAAQWAASVATNTGAMLGSAVANFTGMHATGVANTTALGATVGATLASMATQAGASFGSMASRAIGETSRMRSGTIAESASAAAGIVNQLVSGGARAVSGFGGQIGRLAGVVASSGGAAVGTAYSLGVNIGDALARGLEAMGARVGAAAANLVNQASAAIAMAAAIASPSRVFMYLGEMLGSGLAIGISNMQRDVARAASDLIPASMAGFASPAFSYAGTASPHFGASPASRGGQVTITNHVTIQADGHDPEELYQTFSRRMARDRDRDLESVVGILTGSGRL